MSHDEPLLAPLPLAIGGTPWGSGTPAGMALGALAAVCPSNCLKVPLLLFKKMIHN